MPQTRRLLEWCLPDPLSRVDYVLKFVQYHQRRNHQAYLSHRKRRIGEMENWTTLV